MCECSSLSDSLFFFFFSPHPSLPAPRCFLPSYSTTFMQEPHFEHPPDLRFRHHGIDPVTKRGALKLIDVKAPAIDLGAKLRAAMGGSDHEDRVLVSKFCRLLDACFVLDPTKRCTAADALKHPFLAVDPVL